MAHSGQFKPGQSGNPKGRRPGTGHLIKLRAAILAEVPEVIHALLAQAKNGDTQAAKLLMDRVFPALKPEALPIEFALPQTGGLVRMGEAVLSAISSGDLPPDQGVQLLQALVGQARLVEIDDLTKRIEALESASVES